MESISVISILLIIFIALFFVFRSLILWYYRINDRYILHEQTNQLLRAILMELKKKKD